MKLNEMLEKRKNAVDAAIKFADSHKNESGMLTDEDFAVYESMEKEIENMSREISRMQRQENMERELEKPTSSPLSIKPNNSFDNDKTGRASNEYKIAMVNALRTKFRNVSNVLQESVDSEGGYLVPEEYDTRLIEILEEENIVRSLATKITTGGLHRINVAATKPAAAWIEEGEALSFDDASFDQLTLDAFKLHVAIKVTDELLNDNTFNLENYIIRQFGKALANAEEDAFLNGNGVKKPTGIFAITGGGSTANTVSAVTGDSIIDLVYSLKRPYRKNAVFIMNDKTLSQVRRLKDSTGAYIWQPNYQDGEPDRILGYKVYTSAFAPSDAIAFGDISYYNIGDRGARSFKELTELFAGNDMTGFVAKERVDGKLVLPEAVQILRITASAAKPTAKPVNTDKEKA